MAIFAAAAAASVFGENPVSDKDETTNGPQYGQRYQVIVGIRPFTGEKYPEDENKMVVVVPGDGIIWIDGQRFAISADNGNRSDARLVVVGSRRFDHRHHRHYRPSPSWNEFQQHGHPFPGHRIGWGNSNPPTPPSPPGGHSYNLINWWGAFPRPRPSPHHLGEKGEEESKDQEIEEPRTEIPEGGGKYDIIDLRIGT